ncbi:MAG: fluoride efflux transporter CrcB [Bacteroidetes bacterium HGW-Bacteroidetes-12]|nr:MAG: fluoride efflux transporter CrcB [Bacteroidetes bacterium HGW-Bacteroidetes-12]
MQYLFIFIAGGLGTLCRYSISKLTFHFVATNFPLGTLISNILSCLILALTVIYFNEKIEGNSLTKSIIIIGFCGGFSTFSTFSFETVELLKQGNFIIALSNVLISLCIGVSLIYFLLTQNKL